MTKGLHRASETGRHVRMGVVQKMAMHGKEPLSGLRFQGRGADYTPRASLREPKVLRMEENGCRDITSSFDINICDGLAAIERNNLLSAGRKKKSLP